MDATEFKLKLFLGLLVAVMLFATLLFAAVEHLSIIDAFYFSVVTVATVGYGDIHPTTAAGKILAVCLIVAGVGTFLEVIASITQVMLKRREKELRAEKLSIMTGLFFSEMGSKLLRFLTRADPEHEDLEGELSVSDDWTDERFAGEESRLGHYSFRVEIDRIDLEEMRNFLQKKGDLLLRLLENPILLEQESFTELLRSVFHLRDELLNRDGFELLPESDKRHLEGDMLRAYRSLTRQWLAYARYLRANYPYLFSLTVRTNPFDRNARPVVQ